jgi:hypothetical protein
VSALAISGQLACHAAGIAHRDGSHSHGCIIPYFQPKDKSLVMDIGGYYQRFS